MASSLRLVNGSRYALAGMVNCGEKCFWRLSSSVQTCAKRHERTFLAGCLAALVEPLHRTLREQTVIMHRRLLAIARDDEVCQRLVTTARWWR